MDKKERKEMFVLVGKSAIDFSKLIFASIVLGSILGAGIDKTILMLCGIAVSLIILVTGILLVIKNKEV